MYPTRIKTEERRGGRGKMFTYCIVVDESGRLQRNHGRMSAGAFIIRSREASAAWKTTTTLAISEITRLLCVVVSAINCRSRTSFTQTSRTPAKPLLERHGDARWQVDQ